MLCAVAVAGSMIYGASIAYSVPGLDLWLAALWLTMSAGSAWPVFAALLVSLTRTRWTIAADACLVTMAWGELVLVAGSIGNWTGIPFEPVAYNIAVVGLSNLVMCAVLALRLGRVGVPVAQTVFAWVVGLNGTGALSFFLFHRLLFGVS